MKPSFMTEAALSLQMEDIRTEYQKLNHVVESFRSKIDEILTNQHEEFLKAYRSHVYLVQDELHRLRERANHLEKDHSKTRINALSAETDKLRREALELSAESDRVEVRLRLLSKRIERNEKEKKWTISAIKKRTNNRYSTAELEGGSANSDDLSLYFSDSLSVSTPLPMDGTENFTENDEAENEDQTTFYDVIDYASAIPLAEKARTNELRDNEMLTRSRRASREAAVKSSQMNDVRDFLNKCVEDSIHDRWKLCLRRRNSSTPTSREGGRRRGGGGLNDDLPPTEMDFLDKYFAEDLNENKFMGSDAPTVELIDHLKVIIEEQPENERDANDIIMSLVHRPDFLELLAGLVKPIGIV